MSRYSVTILLFEDVEVMDFAGPFEVFSVADKLNGHELFDVGVVSPDGKPVRGSGGLSINVERSIRDVGQTDLLVVPGGIGTRKLILDQGLLAEIERLAETTTAVMSVCSGALLLGKCGLLDGLEATTHHGVFDELIAVAPEVSVVRDTRFVDNGKILTSAGISAGIDLSLHLVERIHGAAIAVAVAEHMEYRRSTDGRLPGAEAT